MRGRWGRVVAVGACTAAVASSLATVLPAQAASVQQHTSDARPAAPLITSVAGRGLGILVDWAPASASETVTSYELTAVPVVTASVPSTCKKAVKAKVVGDSTMTILTGVCAHVAYRVTISATTSSDTSAWSESSDPVVPLPATAPFVPLVTSVLGREKSLDIEWAPPSYDGGKPITDFVTTVTSPSGGKTIHTSASSNEATITGLHDGTSYRVELWAENEVGKSPMATALGTPSPPHDPGTPTNLSVIPGSRGQSIDVSWTAPFDDGGDAITGYRLTSLEEVAFTKGEAISYRPAPGAKPLTRTVKETSFVVTGLKSTVVFYVFKVAATTKAGTSAPTSYSWPVTLHTVVKSGTKVLSTSVLSALRSSSGGTLTWAYRSPGEVPAILRSLKPGNVLAAGISKLTPDGLLRTVMSVKLRRPDTYVVSTGPASLSSAFGTLTTDISLGSSPFNPAISGMGTGRFIPAGPGIAVRALPHAGVSTTLALSLDYSAQVSSPSGAASLDVEGEVDFTPSLDLEASLLQDWAGIPDGADLSFTASLGVTESDTVSASGTLKQDWPIGPGSGVYPPVVPDVAPQAGDYCDDPFVVMLGVVPLVLTPCVEIDVTLSVTGKLGITSSTSFLYGEEASWSSTDPVTLTLTNLSQVPSTNAPPSTSILAAVEGSLGFDVKPELFLYGVTGPYIDTSIALVADVSPTTQPRFTLDLQLGIAAGWQVVIDFLGIDVQVQASATQSWPLYQSTGPPPASLAPPLSVSPPTANVTPGASQQFSAAGATGAVTWSLTGSAGDRITSSGLFTASSPGGRLVVVTATDSTGTSGSTTVTVGAFVGAPQKLTAERNPSGTGATLSWEPPVPVADETIKSYTVSTSPATVVTTTAGTATGVTIGGLDSTTTYVVSVSAWTTSGFESLPTTVLLSTRTPTGPGTPVNTALPVIQDSQGHSPPITGDTLQATPGSWTNSPTSYSFQWQDCNASALCTDIPAATTDSYVVAASDIDFAIDVTVVASNVSGSSLPAMSAPTGLVAAESGPESVDPNNSLTSVSCVTGSTWCVAVDNAGNVLYFDGTGWSQPDPIDSGTSLNSVSCASETFCVAADSNGDVLTYDGSSWATVSVGNALSDISCTSSSYCGALGGNDFFSFNGSNWTDDGSVTYYSATRSSCFDTDSCVVVSSTYIGVEMYYEDVSGDTLGNAVAIDVDGSNVVSEPTSLSCPSADFCAAGIGFNYSGTVLLDNDGTWNTLSVDGNNTIGDLSCTSLSFCMAVDSGGNALDYDGTTWTPQLIDTTGTLNAISCGSTDFCVAVDSSGGALVYSSGSWN